MLAPVYPPNDRLVSAVDPARVVEIIVTFPDGYVERGSGYLVTGTAVVTAWHVVAGAAEVYVQCQAGLPDAWAATSTDCIQLGDSDVAVLWLPSGRDLPATPLGRLGDGAVVADVQVAGYPRWKLRRTGGGEAVSGDGAAKYRLLVHEPGVVAAAANLRDGTFQVTVAQPAPDPEGPATSPWEGMSGGPVFLGDRLIGVIVEQYRREGLGRLTAARLERSLAAVPDPLRTEVLGRLGLRSMADIAEVPRTVAEVVSSAYQEQVRDIAPLAGLLDREEELQELTRFCAGDHLYLYLQADPWAGKTALMATFALAPPAGVRVVSFFVTARLAGQWDSSAFTEALLEQCAALAGEPLPAVDSPSAKDAHRRRLLRAAAAKVRAAGERLLLMVDGLDEDQGHMSLSGLPSIASLLPKICPEGLHVVVAGRPHPGIPADVPIDHPLHTCPVRLLTASPHARALESAAQQELDRVLAGDQQTPRDVLGLVAASGGGLTLADLEELADQPQDVIARLFASSFGRTIRSRVDPTSGTASKIYLFAHGTLQVQAMEILGPVQLAAYHGHIDSWAATYRDRGWPTGTPQYLLRNYPQALIERRADDRLAWLYLDARYLAAKISLLGTASVEPELARVSHPLAPALAGLVGQNAHLIREGDLPGTVENILFGGLHLVDPALAAVLSNEDRMTPALREQWQVVERSEAMLRRTLIGHTNCVEACAFNDAGGLLASAGSDGLVRLWDTQTARVIRTIDIGRYVRSCSFSPHGKQLAIAVDDGTVRVNAVSDGQEVARLAGHNGWVEACAFSPDGSQLVSSSSDGVVQLWDTTAWRSLRTLCTHRDPVLACVFSSDGTWLATTGNDAVVRVWDVGTGRLRTELRGHVGPVMCCAVSADDSWLVSGGADGMLRIWDLVTGHQVRALDAHDGTVLSCVISRDGTWLASTGNDGKVRVWEATTGAERAALIGHVGAVTCCAAGMGDAWLVTTGEDATVRVWSVNEVGDHKARIAIGHGHKVTSASVGGELLAEGYSDGTVSLRETATGALAGIVAVHHGAILTCAVDSKRERLITAATDGRAYLHVLTDDGFDFRDRQRVELGTGDSMTLGCFIHSEDGWFVTVDENGAAHRWDLGTGAPIQAVHGHDGPVLACVTSPDGSMLVTAGTDGTVRIWDIPTGTLRRIVRGHEGRVLACAISPDGSMLVTVSSDSTAKTWNSLTGRPRYTLRGHEGPVLACAISPDGKWLISAGSDATARIWDSGTGDLATTTRLDGAVISCAWADAGSLIVLTTRISTKAYRAKLNGRPVRGLTLRL